MKRFLRWIPLSLFLFALIVRIVFVIWTQFDGLYGQDSFSYLTYAFDLRDALSSGSVPPPFFWPIGFPSLVALLSLLVGTNAASGQWVAMLAGAAIAPLVYVLVLAYQPTAWRGGLVAGILTAVSAQLLLSSVSVMADTAALFWATLSAWALTRYWKQFSFRWFVLAVITLSLATLTRWVYGLLAIPWGISCLLAWQSARFSWRRMGLAVAVAIGIGGGLFTLHLLPELSRDNSSHDNLSYVGDLQVYSWHPANALHKEQTNSDGQFVYEYATGHFYARPSYHPSYIFPLLAPFWVIGLWALRKQKWAFVVLMVGWLLTIYLFLAGVPWQNWRFPLTFFPPLLVLVGLGFDWVWQRLNGRYQTLLLFYAVVALMGSLAWAVYDVERFTQWANERQETAVAIAAELPPDATLIAFDLTATLQHYTEIDTYEIFGLTETDLAEMTADETAVYLLLNPVNVQTQWVGKSPEQNYRWLQENHQLRQIAEHPPYVLYQVVPQAAP